MRGDSLPKKVQDRIYAERYGLLNDDVGCAVRRILDAGIRDAFSDHMLGDRVVRHKIARAFQGEYLLPELHDGELVIGMDLKGCPIRCPLQFLNAHTLTLAGSGGGKTTRSLFMALQVLLMVCGWLVDLRKREYASLRPHLAHMGVDLIIVEALLLRLNPLQVPEHVTPLSWAAIAADMLVTVLQLPPRASKLLNTSLLRLYERSGVLRGSQNFPVMFELRDDVAADHSANVPAKQAIIDSFDPLLLSIGPVLRYRVGWTTKELSRRRIVFELGGIPEAAKNLILNTLLLSEFTSRVAQGISNQRMNLWICCDEAARLVSPSNPAGGICDLIGLVRGTGVGLDLSVQSSDIAPAILSNTAIKVIGRCGSAIDYDTMSAAMGLSSDQRRWLRTGLEPGLFVGQLGEGQWREPFVFRIPPMRLAPRDDGIVQADISDLARLASEASGHG